MFTQRLLDELSQRVPAIHARCMYLLETLNFRQVTSDSWKLAFKHRFSKAEWMMSLEGDIKTSFLHKEEFEDIFTLLIPDKQLLI